jgi:Flp pilus assembly protein TadB
VNPALASVARAVQLGQPLERAARSESSGGASGPGPLLRALALAQRCGQGGVEAVDVALRIRHDALLDDQRLQAKSAQAAGTAKLLTLLPLAAWALLILIDPVALRFYATPLGWGCGAGTAGLAAAGQRWSRRQVAHAARAAALADPLAKAAQPFDRTRATVVALPIAVTVAVVGHPLLAVVVAAVVGARAGRAVAPTPPPCRSLELVALLRLVLASQTGVVAALELVADVLPPPIDAEMRRTAGRLRSGSDIEDAFAATGMAEIGAVLSITERWGVAPTASLDLLGESIRAQQQAAAEIAAERVQLALVFPTTLLTVPAFVLAVVPPLVWTALAG